MNLNNVSQFVLKVVEQSENISDPEELVPIINEYKNELGTDELEYALELVWAKKFESNIDNYNRLTPFSVSQLTGLVINEFYKDKTPKILELKPQFMDFAPATATSLKTNFEYLFKSDYADLFKTSNIENNLQNAYISQTIGKENNLDSSLKSFIDTTKNSEYLFVLVPQVDIENATDFVSIVKKYQNETHLIGILQIDTKLTSEDLPINLLIFNRKVLDNNINAPEELLLAQIPSFDDLKLLTQFRNYLGEWIKNNIGEIND